MQRVAARKSSKMDDEISVADDRISYGVVSRAGSKRQTEFVDVVDRFRPNRTRSHYDGHAHRFEIGGALSGYRTRRRRIVVRSVLDVTE